MRCWRDMAEGAHHGSPRLTWHSPDGGERRRLKLTRQNGKGNVGSIGTDFSPFPFPPPKKNNNFLHRMYGLKLRSLTFRRGRARIVVWLEIGGRWRDGVPMSS